MKPRGTTGNLNRISDRRIAAALPAVLLLGGILAGCAGSGKSEKTYTSPGHRTVTFPIHYETHNDIAAAVEACREGVALADWLPAASRTELDKSCDQGLKRGLTEVRQYGEQVCSEVVFTIPSSRIAEKNRIFAACEAKTELFEPGMHGTIR